MFDEFRLEDEIGQLATPADAVREYADNAGMDRPDQEWLLHDWDVWVRNPHYTGKPGPHPEEDPEDYPDDVLPEPRWEPGFGGDEPDDIPF